MHEAQTHDHNCFITLTYDQANLPESGSLELPDWQNFAKRARRRLGPFRFFHCGEYGDETRRPHYHAAIFGLDFQADRKAFSRKRGYRLDTSDTLTDLWSKGFATVGDLTFQSAAYVARYIMKKRTGPQAEQHYDQVDTATGEVTSLKPEYTTMSRRPGIGKPWLVKYSKDVYPDDFVISNGKKARPPAFYDSHYEITDPVAHRLLKRKRTLQARKHSANNTPDRLRVREACQEARLRNLPRGL